MESIDKEILIWYEAHLVGGIFPCEPRLPSPCHSDGFLPLRRDFLYFLSVSSSIKFVVCQ